MSTSFYRMTRSSVENIPVEFTDRLITGATITAATATIATSLSGTNGSVGTCVIASPDSDSRHFVYVPVTMGASAALHPDVHVLTVSVTADNTGSLVNETLVARIEIVLRS